MAAQSKTKLKWQKMQLSPQVILYCIENGHEQMLVPQSLRQKIIKEHHDAKDCGPHQTSIFVGWLMGRCWTICAMLPLLPNYEARPHKKGQFIGANLLPEHKW